MDDPNEKMMILKMIEDGKIDPEEGSKLLMSVNREQVRSIDQSGAGIKSSSKWFRVRVTDMTTGAKKATVSLPIALMDWGIRVGAHFAPEIGNLDFTELSDFMSQENEGKIIDVIDEEDGEHVEIFIE